MKCTNCGKDLPADSVFCQYCGSKIEQEKKAEKAQEEIKQPAKTNIDLKKIIIIIASVLVAFVIFYIGSYHVSWHAAASYDFTKASNWLILPAVTDIHDPGFTKYVNAGLMYENGYLTEAKKAFKQSNYTIDDTQITDNERYNKAKRQINAEDYDAAIKTIEPLAEAQYLDSSIVKQDAQCLRALKNATEGKLLAAIDELKILKEAGYPNAEEYLDDVVDTTYDYAIDLYHAGEYYDASALFSVVGINKSNDYITLCRVHTSPFIGSTSYNDVCNLIGFEDAGKLIFYNTWRYGAQFMTGTFSGNGVSITTTKSGDDSYYANWNIPGVSNGNWDYNNGQFCTGGVARFDICATSQNTVRISVISTGKTYVLTRQ